MTPGVTEEVGQTARSVIGVLESQPLALAMIICNFALLAYVFYAQVENNKAWAQENAQRAELGRNILAANQETMTLLSKCVVPEKKP